MDERIKALLEPCKTCGDKRRIQNPEYQPPRFLDEGETYTTPAFIECPDCSREALISGLCQQQMENDKLQADIVRMAKQIEEQRKENKRKDKALDIAFKRLDTGGHSYHKHYHSGCALCEIEQALL